MNGIQITGYILGLLALLFGGFALLKPKETEVALYAFPRNQKVASVLTVIDLLWAAWMLNLMHMGFLDQYKVALVVLAPAAIFLCIKYLDELLAARALGGFLVLVAGPMFKVTRFYPTMQDPSPWRLIITVITYIWVCYGIYLICCPWGFRRSLERWQKFDPSLKIGAIIKITFGIAMLAISFLFYGL